MAGLVPAIHVSRFGQDVDARHKAGHDDGWLSESDLWLEVDRFGPFAGFDFLAVGGLYA
jgi:hypothetical protein